MSKQSEAKTFQGYRMPGPTCASCAHYKSNVINKSTAWGTNYNIDKDIRCAIGGFAIKKTAYCNMWENIENGS